MTPKRRKISVAPVDPDDIGSRWPWLVSPLAMALGFFLLITGLLMDSCYGD